MKIPGGGGGAGGGAKNPLLKFYPKAGQHLGGDGPPPLKRLPFPLYLLLWLSTIESKCFRVEVLSGRKWLGTPQKIPFQISFKELVSSMLFPDSWGDAPVPSSMLFPDSC